LQVSNPAGCTVSGALPARSCYALYLHTHNDPCGTPWCLSARCNSYCLHTGNSDTHAGSTWRLTLPLTSVCFHMSRVCLSGKIEFGVINQSSSAFNHILNDVSLVVYQVCVGVQGLGLVCN
jgi:hypothetical protein